MSANTSTAPARNAGNGGSISAKTSLNRITGSRGLPAPAAFKRRQKRLDKNDYDFSKESGLHQFTADQLTMNGAAGVLWMHTGNGLQRPGKAMNMLKGMGVRAGASDFLICVGGKAHWLELKSPGKAPNDEQLKFMDDARASGCPAFVADTPLEVRQILWAWAAINLHPEYWPAPDTTKTGKVA